MSDDVHPAPIWQRVLLIAWIGGIAAYYYANFTHAFYRANEGAITALLDRLF